MHEHTASSLVFTSAMMLRVIEINTNMNRSCISLVLATMAAWSQLHDPLVQVESQGGRAGVWQCIANGSSGNLNRQLSRLPCKDLVLQLFRDFVIVLSWDAHVLHHVGSAYVRHINRWEFYAVMSLPLGEDL